MQALDTRKASKKPYLAASALLMLLLLAFVGVMAKALHDATALENLTTRNVMSSATWLSGAPDLQLLFDGRPETALPNFNHRGAHPVSLSAPAWVINPAVPFIQTHVGLTHRAAEPPVIDPLKKLWIWSGDQSSSQAFQERARPRRLRVLFFRQRLHDFDREYRMMDAPTLWASRSVELEDRMGAQSVDLGFLDYSLVEDSPGFPAGIDIVWVRLELIDFYPGARYPNAVAISEIAFETESRRPAVLDNP